ncbi:MAG: hypothetical protein WKF71_00175 [Pyrinomonadaceae bacterium]
MLAVFSGFIAQGQEFIAKNPFHLLEFGGLQSSPPANSSNSSLNAQIKDIQVFGAQSGIAFTRTELYRTDDNGGTWREIVLPKNYSDTISTISFLDENTGWAILVDEQNLSLQIARTQ